jgi:hydrogenase/urease accessory protein HupE
VGVRHLRALILIVIILILAALPLAAHEIGTTQVRTHFGADRTYTIDVLTSRQSLERKLARRGGSLLDAAYVGFGAQREIPRVTMLPDGVRYSGRIPSQAGPFVWQFDLAYASYPLTIETPHAPPRRQWVEGDARSEPFPLDGRLVPRTTAETLAEYLVLGFTHIVPLGADHILFVLGMFLLSSRVRPVLAQVTAFTAAHSITLALSIYGVVSLRSSVVEPLIAASIVCIAVENIAVREVRPWRIAVVFAFGLLHGLGFAGVLRELGATGRELVPALVAFNAGVELGQLAVIGAAWLLVVSWTQRQPWYRRRVMVPASLLIAAAGLVWTLQRI